jgi:hypothetical protein
MATTLEEIRKKLQQAQQQQNAVVVSQLSIDEKKRRLKRLKELLTRLKRGDDITRRDLKSVLTEEQWNEYEQANQYLSVDYSESIDRPTELDIYLEKIRQADFYHNRASSTPKTERSRIDGRNRSGSQRLYHQAEACYEDALMYLCGVLEGHDAQLAHELRLWLDRDIDTDIEKRPTADPQSVPRIKGSRSIHSESNKGANKFELKRKYKRDAVESAMAVLKAK